MNNFLNKILFSVLSVLLVGALTGCNPEEDNTISAKIQAVGPEYVDVYVAGPNIVHLAYIVRAEEAAVPPTPQVLFNTGTEKSVKGGSTMRIVGGLKPNTQYFIYLAAKIDGMNFYEVCLPFTTAVYQDNGELLSVVSKDYNSYMVRLTLPAETRTRGNALRFNQCDIMMYNYMRPEKDDYTSLLYNAGNYAVKDTTILYSEDQNWYDTGTDSDGDGKMDLDSYWNPISPGEPIVYVVGEFGWMEVPSDWDSEKSYSVDGFFYPAGWEPGYYLPMIEPTKYKEVIDAKLPATSNSVAEIEALSPYDECWTGVRDRIFFKLTDPEPLKGKVNVQLVDVTPVDATLRLIPDDDVKMYAFGIFDEAMYNKIVDLCGGIEEHMQWAVTSYFAAYTFGTKVAEGPVEAKLTSFYYQNAITEQTKYRVVITAMGDAAGSTQSYSTYEFETTAKVMDAPELVVTAADETHPYSAGFNIKCTTYADNPVTEAYYSADYVCNWLLNINSGKTYFNLTTGNMQFSAAELAQINSEKGLDVKIPTVDGQTVRLVAVGYNKEYTPNDLNYKDILECPAVADYTAPYVTPAPYVPENLYEDLIGDWTATATLMSAKDESRFTYSSKISFLNSLVGYDYEETLPQSVYDLYATTGSKGKTQEEVDALWTEFKLAAEEFTEERLVNQNRLLGLGWFDLDTYDRLDTYTPYDLFVDTKYSSVDVASLYFDFGPKWFLETRYKKDEDGEYVLDENNQRIVEYNIPIDSRLLPPAFNRSAPFDLYGMELNDYFAVSYGDGWTPRFPVTVSEDRNTVTIHPIDYDCTLFYPQMMGVDYGTKSTILENVVVSDIVLTRGWTEPAPASAPAKSRARSAAPAASIQAKGDIPTAVYKHITGFPEQVDYKQIEYAPVSMEEFEKRADELVERFKNRNR